MRRFRTSAVAILLGASAAMAALPAVAQVNCPPAGRGATVGVAPPPPLREEVQPPMPAYGYQWTPGYWGWNNVENDYFWTPGVWVQPPAIGLLWTPGWWGWSGGLYI
ncbi:MAG TPA: hypothetical protein VIB82_10570, partial [Caulobacteraceae bacterium]